MSGAKFRTPVCRLAAAMIGTLSWIGGAAAQVATATDIQRQVDEAFRDVVAHADSTDARLKYAGLLVQAGNFEGGIAALEGLLLSPDAPPGIRVELAVLYYRLGSYAIAETYLREAFADPRLDNTLKQQANALLLDVVKRNQPSSLTGSLMVGLRAQSNPTAATRDSQIMSAGVLVPRDDRVRRKSAVDGQLWGKLDHALDLGAQNEATVMTSLVGFANHYSSVHSYSYNPGSTKPFDIATVGATSGIRFKPSAESLPNLTLKPQLILGNTLLNGHQYFFVGGLGLEGAYRSSDRLNWGGAYEFRHFSYRSRPDIADSSLASGDEQTLRLRGIVETGVNKILVGEIGYIDRDAQRSHLEFRGTEARVAYIFSYADPLSSSGGNWTTTLTGSALQRRYRGADPAIDPTTRRRDTERRLSLVNVVPLARDMALQVQLEYTDAPSNLPNFEYTNVAGSVGVMWKF